uniref:Developmentally-regulated GTP-binding protein 2 n=1 Tax=Arundo donax TaxID=35708 RepID=A0A0A9E804_ARUDO
MVALVLCRDTGGHYVTIKYALLVQNRASMRLS